MLVLKSRAGLHTTINFSFFSVIGWDLDLDHRDIEWFALEMNRDHSVILEIVPKYCILLTMMATPFLLRDSRPQ